MQRLWEGGSCYNIVEPTKFFYRTIVSRNVAQIQSLFTSLRAEARGIISDVIQLSWYMRGAIQYKDMMEMSHAERQLVREFIDSRFEQMKNSKTLTPIY